MDDSFPHIPRDLIEELERRFPERTPDLTMTIDQIRYMSGERAVVRFLRDQFNRQNEAVINQQVL